MQATNTKPLVIGQRVHCILYGGKDGIIVAIHGEQQPDSIQHLGGGIVATGGNACFDIVWANGTESFQTPESILRGVQWRIYDEVADAAAIAAAQANVIIVKAKAKADQEEAQRKAAAEKARILAEFAYLKPVEPGTLGAKHVAANLRIELKRAFPGVKFSIRTGDGRSTVEVSWTDGPPAHLVRGIADKYVNSRFDGMTDCSECTPTVWTNTFGGANYVRAVREESDEVMLLAVEAVYTSRSDCSSATERTRT